MNWTVWERIEPALHERGIKPILAVVPDNRDAHLMVEAPRADFWAKVRAWQKAGWCVALHGYQHRYETRDAGLMGINAYSEFAGLPEAAQREKLRRALAIFKEHDVRADAWVAPAHSFDATTVKLLLEQGIHTISDGFYFRPVRRMGALWIPQQFWHFRPMPMGCWTVCVHFNAYGETEIARLIGWLSRYEQAMTSVQEVSGDYDARPVDWLDRGFATLLPGLRALRRRARG